MRWQRPICLKSFLRSGEKLFDTTYQTPRLIGSSEDDVHENWTLAKAFQDLLRGVRESLEQAYLVTEIAWKHHRVKSDSTLYEFITPFNERAAKLMHLSFPYVRIFYERFGKEVEIEAGVPVDAEDGKDEVQLLMKIDLRMRSFTLNDRLEIAAADFDEIVFAAYYFGTELAAKLPMSPSN
jgi:hypothetical protein